MILVFFKYLIICIFIAVITFIILTINSKIEIRIDNFNINNTDNNKNNKKLLVQVSLKIFNLHWLKIKINKNKLASGFIKQKMKIEEKNINIEEVAEKNIKTIMSNEKIKKAIKNIEIRLDKLYLNINIGVEDAVLTSYLIGVISIIISNILPHIINIKNKTTSEIKNKYKYQVAPLYMNKNLYKINLNCIFDAKLVHIIYVIYLMKRRVDKNERTSNRKSYEYSYE